MNDDQRLIAAVRQGDLQAFGQLVERYQDRLYNALARITGSAEDAQDVAQDAFLQAYRKLDSFQQSAGFYTWLYRIAFNLAVSRRRRHKPAQSVEQMREQLGHELIDAPASPSQRLEQAERAAQVHAALGRLSDEHREILVLREIDELDYQQIAELLEIEVGTVRSRLFRARAQLRDQLKPVLQEDLKT